MFLNKELGEEGLVCGPVITKNINLALANFRRYSDEISHSSLRLENSFSNGSPQEITAFL